MRVSTVSYHDPLPQGESAYKLRRAETVGKIVPFQNTLAVGV